MVELCASPSGIIRPYTCVYGPRSLSICEFHERTVEQLHLDIFNPPYAGEFGFTLVGSHSMAVTSRKKPLEELKSEAIAELERRGYDVRGKTPAQIKQVLRRRPTKPKSDATPAARR